MKYSFLGELVCHDVFDYIVDHDLDSDDFDVDNIVNVLANVFMSYNYKGYVRWFKFVFAMNGKAGAHID